MNAKSHLEDCRKRIFIAGGQDGVFPLGDEDLKHLFAKYPDKFVEIAEAAREETMWAFYAVEEYDVSRKFARSPDSVVMPIVALANLAGDAKKITFQTIRARGDLFVRNPDAFLQVAKAAGKENVRGVFLDIYYYDDKGRFADYCDKKTTLGELMPWLLH